jgi:predicted RecB family nuclease
MKRTPSGLRLSASDLSNHLACRHCTGLDIDVASGKLAAPTWNSPDTQILRDIGIAHENDYVQSLVVQGLEVVNLRDIGNDDGVVSATLLAMKRGADVIVQAALGNDRWFGRADILRKVERQSQLGSWSYEVYDCKLSRETKATTILQLSLYSHLLEAAQGLLPDFMYVVVPGEHIKSEKFRVPDYSSYYRLIKARLEQVTEASGNAPSTYPEPTAHCEVCRWNVDCDRRRRADDHLSLVAGISKLQRKQFEQWNARTVSELAVFPLPIRERPKHGSRDGYARVREQARVQVAGRQSANPVYEVLPLSTTHGFALLPEPSPGDMFFDLEGDPFTGLSGIEYLFGVALVDTEAPQYQFSWALSPAEEKGAFEWFIDLAIERWKRYPEMHIYHFTPYEPSAMKRLMGRYATREDQIDSMLRGRLFVDLHTVLRRSIRASVEHYSLKALEKFHQYRRRVPLQHAAEAMRVVRHGLEANRSSQVVDEVRDTIVLYNADDCLSTKSLRDWLEVERLKFIDSGQQIDRPVIPSAIPSAALTDRLARAATLVEGLTRGIPEDPALRSEEQSAQWLLGALLDWHRREFKVDCWDYFRLRELTEDELLDERSALAGLIFVETLDVVRGIPRDRYSYEKQETDVRAGDSLNQGDVEIGEVLSIDKVSRMIDIKKKKKTANLHPAAVFVDKRGPRDGVLADSLLRLATWVEQNGLNAAGPYRAARALLLRQPPCLRDGGSLPPEAGESTVDTAKRVGMLLHESVLPIQGPPGTGKTYTAARMICELVRNGKKVGITATSHKVIRKLLDDVLIAATEYGIENIRSIQKVREIPAQAAPGVTFCTDNQDPLAALSADTPIAAGTAWMWSREDYFEAVDVLFIDEAGQMSLANVLAVAQAAKSVVLLGDPQQLDQPIKGSHPDGAEVSALEHLLAGAKTIPLEKGLFLDQTWRMHPAICTFTSETFYDGRLHSRAGLERQRIIGHPLSGRNLWFVPVEHSGNQNASPEEVNCIASLVASLVQPGVEWIDREGAIRPLHMGDILTMAPYNAQVSDLSTALPGCRIGTVDKFQGQEAPVVIYSLTTSSPEDAPHGMEFLYSLNRLNVATSRAQAIVILVGSPLLLQPECRTPRQIQLANALCRYIELSNVMSSGV